jgi:hypothetical protein
MVPQAVCPEPYGNSTAVGGGCNGSGSGQGTAADAGAAHAAVKLVARTADCMSASALAAMAPALTWLAQHGTPAAAADVAGAAAYCNSPPPEVRGPCGLSALRQCGASARRKGPVRHAFGLRGALLLKLTMSDAL